MKGVLLFLLLLSGVCPGKGSAQESRAGLPNIVLINVDDLGWKDLGCYGSTFYETPHIDRLASEGMLFTDAYAGAANCAPSRACLLSGQYSPRHGIYTVGDPARGKSRFRKLIPTPNTEVLADSVVTIAEVLHARGYETGSFGKWHLGDDARTQGFQVNVGGSHYGAPGKKGYFSPYNIDFIEDGPEGEYMTDRLGGEAIRFIKANTNRPFFLYLPFYAVHTPLMAKEELVEKYENKNPSGGQDHAIYAAMIETVDRNVGRIMQALDELELTDNTLVLLTSDNGGIRAVSSQEPLRAGKGSYYEGGIRVPLLVRWPGKVQPGSECHIPVMQADLYPTLLDITGSAAPEQQVIDGISLLPLLQDGGKLPERALFWHFPVYLQAYNQKKDDGRDPRFRTRPGSAMRIGKWKIHEYFENGELELYDLETDPGERRNLAGDHPGLTRKLSGKLKAWRQAVKAPVPSELNPDYRPDSDQGE